MSKTFDITKSQQGGGGIKKKKKKIFYYFYFKKKYDRFKFRKIFNNHGLF